MSQPKLHEYRGHFVKISLSRSFPTGKYSGGYVVTNSAGNRVSDGYTPIVPNEELALQLALSLALEAIDIELRKVKN